MPDCRIELFATGAYDPICIIGEMGHVIGSSDAGPRAQPAFDSKSRDAYENLILLCRNCHKKIDGLISDYPPERLQQIKHDHEAWVRTALPERGFSTKKWKVIRLEGEIPFDPTTIDEALTPDQTGSETKIKVTLTGFSWQQVQRTLREDVERSIGEQDSIASRIAVFPLAPVSACLYLGYLLTNRLNVRAFQYHRDAATWAWPTDPGPATFPSFAETTASIESCPEVFFLFHLSAQIDASAIRARVGGSQAVFECSVPNPSTSWLRSKAQLDELARKSRDTFEIAADRYPRTTRWHILYAGPAPGAVVVGQQLNPTMVPATQFYEFQRPTHISSILTGADDSILTRWTRI